MRFAISSAFWDNPSDEALDPWLDEVARIGFDGVTLFVDYWTWGDGIGNGKGIADALEQRRLGLASVVTSVHVDFDRYRKLCEALRRVSCRHLVLIGGTGKGEVDRETLATVLNHIGEIAHGEGIAASYHHHTDTAGESFAEVSDLLSKTDPQLLSLAYDSGHAAIDFFDLMHEGRAVVALQRLWTRIGVVELKDVDPSGGLDTPLGDGITDMERLLAELVARQYNDWVTIEQNPERQRSADERSQCASRSLHFLRTHLSPTQHSNTLASAQP